MNSIKNWTVEDRPREKAMDKGLSSLSNAELLAILIGSGTKNESAVSLGRKILKGSGGLDKLGKKELSFLLGFRGIGHSKGITVMAALELGRRRQTDHSDRTAQITCSQNAYDILGPLLSDLNHEEFWIVCLNRANRVLSRYKISVGGIHGTYVDPKIVFGKALKDKASSIVLYHNHPSGQNSPSDADIKLTKRLVEAGKVLDIKVQDHLIIAGHDYFSFIDMNLM